VSTQHAPQEIAGVVSALYDSRRFGRTLCVNPLPMNSRLCNFDCIYCECAAPTWPLAWDLRPAFPTPEDVHDGLAAAGNTFEADDLESIIVAGNGEPTLSPHLDAIVDIVNRARDRDWPQARTIILTNGTLCNKPAVRAAIAKLDERIIKLDACSNWMFDQLNRPAGRLCAPELLRRISMVNDIVIQSMFVHGPIDNTRPHEIKRWSGWLTQLRPARVQIYSLERQPAKDWVRGVSQNELNSIAEYVGSTTGIPVEAF
jgi:wyosine [tRNA(Phe)-imidazoG37] synthetase (radical SAM superfamily)